MRTLIAIITLSIFGFGHPLLLQGQALFRPATFNGKEAIQCAANPQLDYGSTGTIEMLIRADATSAPQPVRTGGLFRNSRIEPNRPSRNQVDTLGVFAVASNSDGYSTRFTIYLNRSLTRIGMYDGTTFKSVPFNFNDGAFHHVAFSTTGDTTEVIIDDQSIGTLDIGYGPGFNVPLHLGSNDGQIHGFEGEVFMFRLWRKALSATDLQGLKFYSKPPNTDPLFPDLIMYSFFTEREEDLRLAHPTLYHVREGNFGSDTKVEQHLLGDGESYVKVVVNGDFIDTLSLPCMLTFELFVKEGLDTVEHKIPAAGSIITGGQFTFTFAEDEMITGLAGSKDDECFVRTRFTTNKQTLPLLGFNSDPEFFEGPDTYKLEIPEGARLVGIEVAVSSTRTILGSPTLAGVGLIYTFDTPITDLALGTWIAATDGETMLDQISAIANHHYDHRDTSVAQHGNYTSFPLYKLSMSRDGQQLAVSGELPPGPGAQSGTAIEPIEFQLAGARTYELADVATLKFTTDESFELTILPDTNFVIPAGAYHYVEDYNTANADKLSWGATFSANLRPPLVDYNFRGYHIGLINPKDYQLTTGTDKMLFKMPEPDSHDYYFTNNDKIVPYGLTFKSNREAMFQAHTHMVSSEAQYQHAWSVKLGFSVGFPGMSFGMNGEHHESTEHMSLTTKQHAVTTAHEFHYAMVLDKARMELHPSFIDAVQNMRAAYLARGSSPDPNPPVRLRPSPDYQTFIQTFGTHYPYAVTYGGMAYQEISFTHEETKDGQKEGDSLEANASGTLEGITMGVSGGFSTEDGSSFKNVVENKDGVAATIGGDISFGGDGIGWSLPNGTEVPIMLDLRPVSELLSPLYFDDPIIYTDLRAGLNDALAALEQELMVVDTNWLGIRDQRQVEFSFSSLTDRDSEDFDDTGEWIGQFDVTYPIANSLIIHRLRGTSFASVNTTEDGFPDTPSSGFDQALNINSDVTLLVDSIEFCNLALTVTGSLTEQDGGLEGDDDVLQIADDQVTTLNLSSFTSDWQSGSVQFVDPENGAHATLNYTYRQIIPPGAEAISCPATSSE